jgi:hypothetical protein
MAFNALELLLEMESEIIENMTTLLGRGALASAEWQAQKLLELGALREFNEKTVVKYLTEIQNGLPDQYAKLAKDKILESNIPGLADVIPPETEAVLASTWLVWEQTTMNQLKNLGMTLIDSAQQTFINIVYKSTAKMLIGDTTLRQAIAETATQWLGAGIPALVDKAGRKWSVEGYAQLVLRSNETQMTWASQERAFDEYDVDLVEITSHLGARPNCAPYQGRVYSRSGTSTRFPALSSTSIGQPDGIKGCNCGHDIWPYNPAVGKTYHPYPEGANNKAYAASQKQRYYERRIRNSKKELNLAKLGDDENLIKRKSNNLSAARDRMRTFIDESERTRRYDREKVY